MNYRAQAFGAPGHKDEWLPMKDKPNIDVIICDCEYYEPPCKYCCTDAIVSVSYNGQRKYMRRSEVKNAFK